MCLNSVLKFENTLLRNRKKYIAFQGKKIPYPIKFVKNKKVVNTFCIFCNKRRPNSMNSKGYYQDKLVELLKKKLKKGQNLAQELQDILHLSRDGAYRRIRGDTPFTLEEVVRLALHFHISIDGIFQNLSSKYHFDYFSFDLIPELSLYFDEVLEELKRIRAIPQVKLIYTTKDIPLFHFFNFPELVSFKLFFWLKTINDHVDYRDKTFDLSEVDDAVISIGQEIMTNYYNISSVEIWWEDLIESTLKPIIYYYETRVIEDKQLALQLLTKVELLVKHLQKMAANGKKYGVDEEEQPEQFNYKLYYDEVTPPDNTILILSDTYCATYMVQNTIDYLRNTNREFCNYTHRWMDNLMRKSALISVDDEKQRKKFFHRMLSAIDLARETIEKTR